MKIYLVISFCLLSWLPAIPSCYGATTRAKKTAFRDYIATKTYTGRPASPDLSSDPDARRFRTRLNEGARKGVNFAGAYTIVGWGCGTNCKQLAILDTRTGRVLAWFGSCGGESYRRDSRLLIVNPGAGEPGLYPYGCRTEYYVWNGRTLDRIRQNR